MSNHQTKKHRKLSKTSAMHYFKLVFRSLLLIVALAVYLYHRIHGNGNLFETAADIPGALQIIWIVFMVEMILRMFPASIESMGCQKQFKRNYRPCAISNSSPETSAGETNNPLPEHLSTKRTLLVAFVWIVFNLVIGALYWTGLIDEGILFLISLAYSVCDMICILFFCPFQSWFMKNRCCTTCRIYNWDFAMMFTPLIFTHRWYTWSLVIVSLIVLLQWEITFYRHPERFMESTNESLACKNCTEKLCHHKTQLRSLWMRIKRK